MLPRRPWRAWLAGDDGNAMLPVWYPRPVSDHPRARMYRDQARRARALI